VTQEDVTTAKQQLERSRAKLRQVKLQASIDKESLMCAIAALKQAEASYDITFGEMMRTVSEIGKWRNLLFESGIGE
jgi:hypothetical protein